MTIKVWNNFSKRENSTKQPAANSQTATLTAYLKDETSQAHPVFTITGNVNYTYVESMGNYYFVDDIRHTSNGTSELICTMDDMASHKTEVGNTIARILYSSSGYDANIIDSRMTSKVTKQIDNVSATVPLFDATGCYILAIANITGGPTGAASQYVLNASKLNDVLLYLSSTDIINDLKNMVKSSMETVLSCFWVPFDYTTITTGGYTVIDTIHFGEKDSGISSFRLVGNVHAEQTSMVIPWKYSDFRRQPPYTSMSLYLPFFGNVDINVADLIGETNFGYVFSIDVPTGDITFMLTKYSDATVLKTVNYNVAVNCPIVSTTNNMSGAITNVGGAVGGLAATVIAAASGNVGAALGAGAATIMAGSNAALQYNSRSTSVKGSTQGRSMSFANNTLSTKMVLSVFSQLTEDPDNANYIAKYGRPVCQTHAINSHSGYVQCDGASVDIVGFASDRENINKMLNSGFFYE